MPVPDDLLDFAVVAQLAGLALTDRTLERLHERGHTRLRVSHGYLFQHLIDGPITVGELAQRLGVTQQAVSKTAAELSAAGYLQRMPDATDGRVRRVALTERGRAAVRDTREIRAELVGELAEKLGADRVESARRTLLTAIDIAGGAAAVRNRRVRPAQ
ncbi:MarR family transcriptional regulator [Pseudonocardia sp. DSM 110487]|uniref:MarR family winged helix-turn-helix transcriptional regulator n=1 Tax=Pseudonocardia sp. DSM 110487 TaxID=2865833 RepID=UPI001C69FF97|nr:MarR family transcriptional regulator [Pseudonocardia sp. DSM 110487]QYN35940.1 MarR family transcriptional regulator [Pseudonocardia sp. DSM 110487]